MVTLDQYLEQGQHLLELQTMHDEGVDLRLPPPPWECSVCDGTGLIHDAIERPCPACDGRGDYLPEPED